jgi:hypothetical protein
MMAKTTRYLGFCPCCGGTYKVRSNKLVHHGYKRPGHGSIEGDCHGALRTPHELSDELAREFYAIVCGWAKSTLKAAVNVSVAEELFREKWNYDTGKYEFEKVVKAETGPRTWADELAKKADKYKRQLRAEMREVERLHELVFTWEKKDLTSVEEEKAAKRAAKAAREAANANKKAEKVAAQVAKYQKRIDSALKSKNSRTLADIWEQIQRKLPDIDRNLSNAEALRLVDRDKVWVAFGLEGMTLSPWRQQDKPEELPLKKMKWRMDRIKSNTQRSFGGGTDHDRKILSWLSLEWPPELGGENKKGAASLAEVRELLPS